MFAQVADQRHFVEAGLGAAGFDFGEALFLHLVGEFETLQILISGGQFFLTRGAFALQVFQRVVEFLAADVNRLEERGKGKPADVGVGGALALARNTLLEDGEFLLHVGFHAVEGAHATLQFVDPELP